MIPCIYIVGLGQQFELQSLVACCLTYSDGVQEGGETVIISSNVVACHTLSYTMQRVTIRCSSMD